MSHDHAVPAPEDRHRLAMASSATGMAIVALDGSWQDVNPSLARMLGYDIAEMIGQQASGFSHPDDVAASRSQCRALVAGRVATIDTQQRYLHRSGRPLWMQVNIALMRGGSGTPISLVATLSDVTDQRDNEAMLRARAGERAQQLDASNQQLQMFADAISHDLRAPLRSIESFSSRLAARLGADIDATSGDYLARIRSAAARMSGLLSAITELSYVTRAELRTGPVDLSLLAEWVLAELQEADPGRTADLQVQPDLAAHGDERLLKVLLTQLIGNAWKFSRDSATTRIHVTGERRADGGLLLQVVDAGSGYDMRYADKVFEPFQRLHGPDQGGGHGLGLAIAQRIVERHHGRMHAESRPGEGSTFHVELPPALPPPDAVEAT